MARPRTLPDNDQIAKHLRDGWSRTRIAKEYGTTREAVSAMVLRYGMAPPKVGRHADYIPWTIAPEHRRYAELRKLRYYSKRMQGEQLTFAEERELDNWLADMNKDPDCPMVLAYNRVDGWHYVERDPQDGDGIVRRPPDG